MCKGAEVIAPDTAITLYPIFVMVSVVYNAEGALSAVTIHFLPIVEIMAKLVTY